MGPVPEGRQRFKFLIVGFDDNSIKVLSLEEETMFVRVSLQGSLPSTPCSIAIAEMSG